MRRRRFPLRPLVAVLLVGAVAFVLWRAYEEYTVVESGEDVASVSWLPPSARRVSFYRSGQVTAYEFDMPESEFLTWAAGRGWPMTQVAGGSLVVPRYGTARGGAPAAAAGLPASNSGATADEAAQRHFEAVRAEWDRREKRIERGFGYRHELKNGGGTTVGYDAERGRAYVYSSSR